MLKNRPGEFGFLSVKNVRFSKSRYLGVVMAVTDTIFLTLLYNEIVRKWMTILAEKKFLEGIQTSLHPGRSIFYL